MEKDKKTAKVIKLPDTEASCKENHVYMVLDHRFEIEKRY